MRRITRLRSSVSLIHAPASPAAPSASCDARCLLAAAASRGPSNSFFTSRPRQLRPAIARLRPQEDDKSAGLTATQTDLAAALAEAEEMHMAASQSLIKLPPRPTAAKRQEEILDSSYVPATSSDGLEEVGGLEGWFEQEGNWSRDEEVFPSFGPREKVRDAAALEAIARRAVAEALAVRDLPASSSPDGDLLPALVGGPTWAVGGRDAAVAALSVEIEVSANGAAKVASSRVVDHLSADGVTEDVSSAALDAGEVAEISSTWTSSWKKVSLRDPVFKFAVSKRVQQLSGQILSDSKLMNVHTVRDLLDALVAPPKNRKVAEEIRESGDLLKLPNVSFQDRRVTPIDREKAVGRWKVVVNELQKRDLPVTGTGRYGRSVEQAWMRGRP